MSPSVVRLQGEMLTHAFPKPKQHRIIGSVVPRSVPDHAQGTGSGHEFADMSGNPSLECQICIANSQDMVDALMVIVEVNRHVRRELPLQPDVQRIRIGRSKLRIHSDRNAAGGEYRSANRKIAEGVVRKRARR